MSDEMSNLLQQKADKLTIAHNLGAEAYLLASHEAASDDVPSGSGIISPLDLLQSDSGVQLNAFPPTQE